MIRVFTSSAPNYLGKVRALAESVREHCGAMSMLWLVADDHHENLAQNLQNEAFDEILFATDVEPGRDRKWLFVHDIVELATAIKPFVALELLSRPDTEMVIYFDPDIVLFSPIDDLIDQLRTASIVLTPHVLVPGSGERGLMNELDCLKHGVFNLGFLGVRKCDEGIRFLEWWAERCGQLCVGDWGEGAFTDQKWVNLAPIFFPDSRILRTSRFNVAPWNVDQRHLTGTFDEGFWVDGQPLGFYHFTGFDSGAHEDHAYGVQADSASIKMLVQWYRARTDFLARDNDISWKLGSYRSGEPILKSHRSIYRARTDLQVAFPNPYESNDGAMSFCKWILWQGPLEYPDLLGRSPGA